MFVSSSQLCALSFATGRQILLSMSDAWHYEAIAPTSHAYSAHCLHGGLFQWYLTRDSALPVSLQVNASPPPNSIHLRGPLEWVWLEMLVKI